MLLLVLGLALVLAVVFDALWTTLALKGAGPISGRLSAGVWWALRLLPGPGRRHRVLSLGGTLTVLAILTVWLAGLLVGWTLIFSADPASVVHLQTQEPASFWQRFYFTGYTVTTLGIGDFVPVGGWRFVTVLCAVTGLVFITLSITYFAPVIDAVMAGRRLATYISTLGRSPQDLLVNAWDGRGFGMLDTHLASLAEMLNAHTHRHYGYPVIHYFHSPDAESAVPLRLAVLDEALTLLRYAVAEEARPRPPSLHAVRGASTGYLRVISSAYVAAADHAPPPTDLGPLREAGIPLADEAAFHRALVRIAGRRRLLLGLVKHDGWAWEDVPLEAAEGGLLHEPLGEEGGPEPEPVEERGGAHNGSGRREP